MENEEERARQYDRIRRLRIGYELLHPLYHGGRERRSRASNRLFLEVHQRRAFGEAAAVDFDGVVEAQDPMSER